MAKKEIPNKITKKFMFEVYWNQFSDKTIRFEINYTIKLLGGNVRKRILSDIVFLTFIKQNGLPDGYVLSEKMQEKYLRIQSNNVKNQP